MYKDFRTKCPTVNYQTYQRVVSSLTFLVVKTSVTRPAFSFPNAVRMSVTRPVFLEVRRRGAGECIPLVQRGTNCLAYQLATAHATLDSNPQQTKCDLTDLNNDTSVLYLGYPSLLSS